MPVKLSVSREKRGLGHENARKLILRAAAAALAAEGVTEDCALSALLTDDEGIREINREYRGIDSATDVLSFPLNELEPGEFDAAACERDLDTGRILLGDMAFSLEAIRVAGSPARRPSSETGISRPVTLRAVSMISRLVKPWPLPRLNAAEGLPDFR